MSLFRKLANLLPQIGFFQTLKNYIPYGLYRLINKTRALGFINQTILKKILENRRNSPDR